MGNSQKQRSDKQVIIVGFSYAGFALLTQLIDHFQVTIIDQKDYFEHIPTSMKCGVDPDWVDHILFPINELVKAHKDSFRFIQGVLKQVNSDNTIEIVNSKGSDKLLNYDYLVICTGFSYGQPFKSDTAMTIENRRKEFNDWRESIEKAQSILVVGGGVVGVEMVGELAVKYAAKKEKKIGICVKGDKLLSLFPPQAGRIAEDFLKRNNVEILYGTSFDDKTCTQKGYELAIKCTGQTFHTDFMKKHYSQCLSHKSGQIFVNDLMQISAIDPLQDAQAPGVKENIFCLGEVCLTSLREEKGIFAINNLAEIVSSNIIQIAKGQRPSHQVPNSLPFLCLTSLGPNAAVFMMNGKISFSVSQGQFKFQSTEKLGRVMRGDLKMFKENESKKFAKLLCCITCCCCCCPCSNCFTRNKKRKVKTL